VITNRELSIYRLPRPQFAVKEMFRKSKPSRADAEPGSREAYEIYLSPVIMTLMEQTYAPTTKFPSVNQMAMYSASGLRIRTGLGL
jgi:hypothetical protein